jgi:hypothetical protein
VVLSGRERGRVRRSGVAYDVEFVQRLVFRTANSRRCGSSSRTVSRSSPGTDGRPHRPGAVILTRHLGWTGSSVGTGACRERAKDNSRSDDPVTFAVPLSPGMSDLPLFA